MMQKGLDKKEIILKAMVDPKFRKELLSAPEKVLGKMTREDMHMIERMKTILPGLDEMVNTMASNILCGGGGGCPGLA